MIKRYKKITALMMGLTIVFVPISSVWAETGMTEQIQEENFTDVLAEEYTGSSLSDDVLMPEAEEHAEDISEDAQENTVTEDVKLYESEGLGDDISEIKPSEISEESSDVNDTNESVEEPDGQGFAYSNPRKNADGSVTYDCVWFGNYWQDDTNGDGEADTKDNKTPIKWRVLSASDDDLFLLADKILDAKAYNTTYTSITWEKSTVRSWLNGYGADQNECMTDYLGDNFIDRAFDQPEQAAIKNSFVDNSIAQCNTSWSTKGGNDTYDKLFFLSYKESITEAYGFSANGTTYDKARRAKTTVFAKANGARTSTSEEYKGNGWWWLRSPGHISEYAADVNTNGYAYAGANYNVNYADGGVRPALHISPSSSLLSPAGTVCSDGTVNENAPTTVFFESNGGSSVSPIRVEKGGRISKPTDPTKEGCSFGGWYKDKGFNELYDFDTPVNASFTLYAKWIKQPKEIGTKDIVIPYSDDNSTTVKWGSSLFKGNSIQRNNDILRLCAALSAAAEDGGKDKAAYGKYIAKAYQDKNGLDVDGFALYSYEKSEYNQKNVRRSAGSDPFSNDNNLAFSIAHKGIKVNGEDINVVFIVGRGTQEDIEGILDAAAGKDIRPEFSNNLIYNFPWNFASDMWAGLYDYADKHEEITDGRLIFVVTGHSLGGAAANLFAAHLTDFNNNLVSGTDIGWAEKNDIYCYTFGAIPSVEGNICNGYENIHNIFNILDTFGPYGPGTAPLGFGLKYCWPAGVTTDDASSIFKKYGHLELFAYDFYEGADRPDPKDTRNHNMEAYIDASDHCDDTTCYIYGRKGFGWHCNGEDMEMFDYYYSNMLGIHCPVDVEIYKDDVLMGRVVNNKIEQSTVKIPIFVQGDEKYVVLPNKDQYRVVITATDNGKMKYSISGLSGDDSDAKEFTDISLTKGKIFTSEVGNKVSKKDVKLYVENGKGEKTYEVTGDGTEIKYNENGDVIPEDIPEDGKIPEGIWIAGVKDKKYTGSKITQSFRVYDGTTLLNEKVDYTVACKNNVNVYTLAEGDRGFDPKKAPSITVTGKGNYDSKEVVYFKILPLDISGTDLTADDITLPATGKKQTIKPALYWKDKALKNKTDYKFAIYKASDTSYSNPLGDSVTEAGDYMVRFTGNGNFTGTRDTNLKLTSEGTLVSKLKVGKIAAVAYSGKEIKPEPEVYDGKTLIEKGKHYTLSYASNVDPGTGYVIITGIPENGYAGSRRVSFKINAPKSAKAGAYDISESKDTEKRITVTCSEEVFFMKGGAKPAVTVMYKDAENKVIRLIEGRDYKIAFKNNTAVGGKKTPLAVISGTGNFKGKREIPFSIKVKSLDKVTLLADDVPFKNKANSFISKITITDEDDKNLSSGKDYEKEIAYTYVNDTEVTTNVAKILRKAGDAVDKQDIIPADTIIRATATAKAGSGYTGTVSGTYRIVTANISSAKVTIPAQVYTGKPITPTKKDISVVVKGTRLNEDEYEIVGYSNNINKGTAKVTIRGTGNYGGLKTESFKIKAKGFTWWWR